MGVAAILVKWPGPFEQIFVPPSQWGSTWNLASIGPVVSEEKIFEKCWQHTYIPTYRQTTEAYLYYKLTYELKGSGELKRVVRGEKSWRRGERGEGEGEKGEDEWRKGWRRGRKGEWEREKRSVKGEGDRNPLYPTQ